MTRKETPEEYADRYLDQLLEERARKTQMDYYCKHCAQPVEHISGDNWEHKDFNPDCGTPELNTP